MCSTSISKEKTICLFGVPMHTLTMEETVEEIDRRMQNEQFTQHVVVNVAKVVHMQSDTTLRSAVLSCDIIGIDGAGIVFGGRFLGYSIPERVAGVDLFENLLDYSESTGKAVYFLGAKPDVLSTAIDNIRSRNPDLIIAGFHHGYFWNDEAAVVKNIRDSGADLLFVGISSPKKEKFIDDWSKVLGVKFAMGVGGTFDVIAGKVKRAPPWMQRVGMEWFYRVLQEPRRMWKRYLVTNSKFLVMVLREKMRTASGRDMSNRH